MSPAQAGNAKKATRRKESDIRFIGNLLAIVLVVSRLLRKTGLSKRRQPTLFTAEIQRISEKSLRNR
jgi:hypothetical protein